MRLLRTKFRDDDCTRTQLARELAKSSNIGGKWEKLSLNLTGNPLDFEGADLRQAWHGGGGKMQGWA